MGLEFRDVGFGVLGMRGCGFEGFGWFGRGSSAQGL